ncbi:hypothetical protein ACIGHG_15695 [Bacillus sp. NPDC077411]|uniref:hypothetical protein n=1 Tax=Bacillus sp. NPDC077411 TaxID=3363947 RepID=UPI0037C789B3
MVKELNLLNEEEFIKLLKRSPCEPLIYLIKVQDKVKVEAQNYYKILMKKYEEEGNMSMFKVVREYEYLMRDDRERQKDW